jgi:prefoldin subunit 5
LEEEGHMPRKTTEDYRAEITDLKDQIGDLEEENDSLQTQLDAIANLATGDFENGEEDEDQDGCDDE